MLVRAKHIFLFILTFSTVLMAQDKDVVVTGEAAIQGGNTMGARQQALTAAFRAAVESGLGTLIQSSTTVKNFQLVSDKIYSQSQGYVKNYDVLQEGVNPSNSNYSVKIKAVVNLANLTTDLRALGVLENLMGNPKIMSMIDEVSVSKGESILAQDPSSSIALEEKLKENNFELVDREQVNKIRQEEMERMGGDFNMEKMMDNPDEVKRIAQKAQEYGAQYLLMGTTIIEQSPPSGGRFQANAAFKCKIVDAATAEKVALTQKAESGIGNSVSSADMYAGQKVGESAALSIIPQIVQNWSKRSNSGVAYIVKVYGIKSYGEQGRKILSAMKSVSGVTACNKRLWDDKLGRLEMDVTYKGGSGDELIDGIFETMGQYKEIGKLDLVEQTGNNLNFKIK